MADFYTRMRTVAIRLIQKFGGAATIRRYTSPAAPAQPWRPGVSTSEDTETVAACIHEMIDLMDGTSIPTKELRAYVPVDALPEGFVPTTRDTFHRGAQQWSIKEVEIIDPSGANPVLYVLVLSA